MKGKKIGLCIIVIAVIFLGVRWFGGGQKIIITQYADDSGNMAMFYTIESSGDLWIVDGGWEANAGQVRSVIDEKGGKVKGWILTHPHEDHIGAFNEIYPDLQGIEIEEIYTIDMDYDVYQENAQEWDNFPVFDTFYNLVADAENITYLHTGDTYSFNGMQIEVFNAYDDTTIEYSTDLPNEGSLVFKVSGKTDSMLFCSDTYDDCLCSKVMNEFGDKVKSTYLQMGHHGNHSVTEEFVSRVQPKAAFFDAPQWLIEGENFDTQKNIDYVESIGAEVYTCMTAPNRVVMK